MRERLAQLLDYVAAIGRLSEKPVYSWRSYSMLGLPDRDLEERVGIQTNLAAEDSAIWIEIQRLTRKQPPQPPEELVDWIQVSESPDKPPSLKDEILQRLTTDDAQEQVDAGRVSPADVMEPPKVAEGLWDVRLRRDGFPELEGRLEAYLQGPWLQWAEAERPRRQTRRIYEQLFQVLQAVEQCRLLNADFQDMLNALSAEGVEFLLVRKNRGRGRSRGLGDHGSCDARCRLADS